MNQQEVAQPLLTSRIVWGALMFSTLVYGFVLFTSGKDIVFKVPVSYEPMELGALLTGLILFITFNISEKKIKPLKEMEKRFPYYVLCWALHEIIVVSAFVAVFLGNPGNMLIFGVNIILAWFGNIITFPRVFKV